MSAGARVLTVAAAAAACAWALFDWVYLPQSCNAAVSELARRTTLVGESRGDFQYVTRAKKNLEDLLALRPQCTTELQIPVLIATNEESLGRYEEAIRSYQDALTIDRRPELYVAIGDALIQLGRSDEAVELYVTAARFNPGVLENGASEEVVRRAAERLRAGH